MSSTTPPQVATPPLPEQYRALIFSLGGVLFSGLLTVQQVLIPGQPMGAIGYLTVTVAALTSLGVYFPRNPWAKFTSGVLGVVGQTIVSSAQGSFTKAELITVAIMTMGALGIGVLPNRPPA